MSDRHRHASYARPAAGRVLLVGVLAAVATALAAALPASARAVELPPGTLPGVPVGSFPGLEDCPKGDTRCVDKVIREMDRQLTDDARSCSHDAIFSVVYLRTTESYRRAVENPWFFHDNAFVNNQDVIFAAFYFQARDAWRAGRASAVAPAWRVAFDAAERRAVTATGNALMAVNAHVNHDLPFVLEAIGLVTGDKVSRKHDHDKVNRIFPRAYDVIIPELARRFDRTADDGDVPGVSVDNEATLQMLYSWREEAWRNAERLVAAPTPAARALVAKSIFDAAEARARAIRAAFAYGPLRDGAADRDAWCAANGAER